MENLNDLSEIGKLGIGGILAGVLFWFYRKDVKQYTDQWKGQSETVLCIVKENTAAITRNTVVIESLHKRLDNEFGHYRRTAKQDEENPH